MDNWDLEYIDDDMLEEIEEEDAMELFLDVEDEDLY